jgi:transposase
MMGTQAAPERLFYDFCLEDHVPDDHLLRRIDRVLDLSEVRQKLKSFYCSIGRPSIDPELMIRMLIVGYCLAIRSERRLCEEVHLNLAYRWFCRLGLEGQVPDHSTFLAQPPWPLPSEQYPAPCLRSCRAPVPGRRACWWRGLCG